VTGISRYTIEMVSHYAAQYPEVEIALITAGEPVNFPNVEQYQRIDLDNIRLLPVLMTWGNLQLAKICRKQKFDIIHDPTGVLPFLFGAGRAKIVVSIHDVFAYTCPTTTTLLTKLIYRYWLPFMVKRASAIITPSEFSKGEIVQYLNASEDKVYVVPYGISPIFRQHLPNEVVEQGLKDKYGIQNPYILYVGALTYRKNLVRALEAFAKLAGEFPDLYFVLVGPKTLKKAAITDAVASLKVADRVILTGPVSNQDLQIFYQGCRLLLFPSLCEGFGLPPVEAMASGAPVVVSNLSSMPEIVGDAAITVDPYDIDAMAGAVRNILEDPELHYVLKAKGLKQASKYIWKTNVQAVNRIYEQIL
jgi:glycosyltransferase involved in cell wall biosynthesis